MCNCSTVDVWAGRAKGRPQVRLSDVRVTWCHIEQLYAMVCLQYRHRISLTRTLIIDNNNNRNNNNNRIYIAPHGDNLEAMAELYLWAFFVVEEIRSYCNKSVANQRPLSALASLCRITWRMVGLQQLWTKTLSNCTVFFMCFVNCMIVHSLSWWITTRTIF